MSEDPDEVRTVRLQSLLDGAGALAEDGDFEAALGILDGAPEDLKTFGTYDYVRGSVLVQLGRLEDAVTALQQAVEREPEIAELRSNLGAALLELAQAKGPEGLAEPGQQDALARGLEVLSAAAKMNPMLPDVHANHGRALHLSGRVEEALIAYERGLQIESAHVPTLYNKAAALAAKGDDRAVLATLDRILSIAPDFAPAVASRQHALERLGES